MRAIFVRHAESLANIGEPCYDFAQIPITANGRDQARSLAVSWTESPSLIVHSPFLRAQQTAASTIDRFRHVEVQVWPVHEFTNLAPSCWNGTLPADRLPAVEDYWRRCDPYFCDGQDAENFSAFLDRARQTLVRLRELPEEACVYVFSHGYFMHAVRCLVTAHESIDVEHMKAFVPAFIANPIRNTDRFELVPSGDNWILTTMNSREIEACR
jgi:broad specificity phosphatase PhoE